MTRNISAEEKARYIRVLGTSGQFAPAMNPEVRGDIEYERRELAKALRYDRPNKAEEAARTISGFIRLRDAI